MRRRYSGVSVVVLAVVAVACGRDPGLDVKPMADPLARAPGAPQAVTEIIPLDKVSKSQAAAVSQRIANTEITLTYSRPVARRRELFGALVPYDQIWNPGADRATAISISRDVRINDEMLAAGRYSIWASPGAEMWTVIFSRAADVYHTPYPGPEQDALRLSVRPERGPHMEALTFYFPVVEGKDATLRLHWGEVIVPLSISVP
jgi:hypothetical protein